MRALLATSLIALLACCRAPGATVTVDLPTQPAALECLLLRLMSGAPPARPLGVTLLVADEDDGNHGYARNLGGDQWLIQIDASMCPALQRMVLTHEWAHVLVGGGGCGMEGDHGPTFGVAWAASWRAAVGEDH